MSVFTNPITVLVSVTIAINSYVCVIQSLCLSTLDLGWCLELWQPSCGYEGKPRS